MENSVPKRRSFSLKELQELGFIKIPTAKKLIRLKKLKSFKIGVKHFVLREAVLEYIKDNTIH